MRKFICCSLITVNCLLFSGCTSSGPVIGPLSYMANQHNQKLAKERNIQTSQKIPLERKESAIKAVRLGAGDGEIAAGIGIDLLTLAETKPTAGEMGLQLLGAAGDLAGYALLAKEIKDSLQADEEKPEEKQPQQINNNGTLILVNGNQNEVNSTDDSYNAAE